MDFQKLFQELNSISKTFIEQEKNIENANIQNFLEKLTHLKTESNQIDYFDSEFQQFWIQLQAIYPLFLVLFQQTPENQLFSQFFSLYQGICIIYESKFHDQILNFHNLLTIKEQVFSKEKLQFEQLAKDQTQEILDLIKDLEENSNLYEKQRNSYQETIHLFKDRCDQNDLINDQYKTQLIEKDILIGQQKQQLSELLTFIQKIKDCKELEVNIKEMKVLNDSEILKLYLKGKVLLEFIVVNELKNDSPNSLNELQQQYKEFEKVIKLMELSNFEENFEKLCQIFKVDSNNIQERKQYLIAIMKLLANQPDDLKFEDLKAQQIKSITNFEILQYLHYN